MSTKILAVGASALLVFAVAACNEAEPTPDPELAFCDSLEVLVDSVASLDTLGASSTVDDVQSGVEAVQEAAGEVKDAAGDLAESQVEAIQTAVSELQSYSDSIDESETMDQVVAGLAAQVAAIKQARAEAGTAHCGLAEAQVAVESMAADAQDAVESMAADAQDAVESMAADAQDAAAEVSDRVEDAADALESPEA